MKISYDSDVDVLRILFKETVIEYSEDVKDGFILDYDADDQIVGLEMLNASRHTDNPTAVAFAVINKQMSTK
jgi:uncharacterized protein YuzE